MADISMTKVTANVGMQVIFIACSWQVSIIPILQSPHDVALIFRTCHLHTAWELLHENGGSEHQAGWYGQLHWKGRQNPGNYQTRRLIDSGIFYPR